MIARCRAVRHYASHGHAAFTLAVYRRAAERAFFSSRFRQARWCRTNKLLSYLVAFDGNMSTMPEGFLSSPTMFQTHYCVDFARSADNGCRLFYSRSRRDAISLLR